MLLVIEDCINWPYCIWTIAESNWNAKDSKKQKKLAVKKDAEMAMDIDQPSRSTVSKIKN